ncbi:BgTH12-04373 [Blumeria graminis f. sp. triticale]|uniref:BgTH12-04373 n=1 Tax=Blumeria graminis f. sp. triticale TaxID=1689686 RepID=A0A9W4GAS2_BLUGR|nr:BgTH12-04373 [Blumeria graminis f. sp. triticale]
MGIPADISENVKSRVLSEETPLLRETTPSESEEDIIGPEPSSAELFLVISSVYFGIFLGALDGTIIATLSASISTHFSSLTLLSWLVSAYLIANAASQPLLGRLTDIFTRQKGLIACNLLFAAGNLISGLSTSEGMMILGRVVAGLGGGGLMAIPNFIASDLVPLRKRGLIHGISNICFSTGAGLGSFLGGWINDVWGWRWAFLLQVPLTMISCIMVYFTVKIPAKKSSLSALSRVDFLGAATLIVSIVLLLFGLNSAGNIIPWNHPFIPTSITLSLISLMVFVYVEIYIASEPIIPIKLLAIRTVASACLTTWFSTMVMYMVLFYLPIFFQVKGLSATSSGIRIIPQFLGSTFTSVGCGIIINATGQYKRLLILILSSFCLTTGFLTTLSLDGNEWFIYIYEFILGATFSSLLTITLIATISAVSHDHRAVVTSAVYAFRSTGATIGVTIGSAVYQNILLSGLHERFDGIPGSGREIEKIRNSLDEMNNLPPGWDAGVRAAFDVALRSVFTVAFLCAILTIITGLFIRQHVLHSRLVRHDVNE